MNSGDVFILDAGMQIWLWLGSESGRLERIKGFEVARRIRDEERGGKAKLIDFGKITLSVTLKMMLGNLLCYGIGYSYRICSISSRSPNSSLWELHLARNSSRSLK